MNEKTKAKYQHALDREAIRERLVAFLTKTKQDLMLINAHSLCFRNDQTFTRFAAEWRKRDNAKQSAKSSVSDSPNGKAQKPAPEGA